MKRTLWIAILVLLCVGQWAAAKPKHDKDWEEWSEEKVELAMRKARLELDEREARLDQLRASPCRAKGSERPAGSGCGCNRSKGRGKHCFLFILCVGIVHILLTIWVFSDIRKRNAGSGIWIVITLMTGLLGALVYSVVRIGDARNSA